MTLGHQGTGLDADRLVDHTLLLRVVAHLDLPDQREVLAERVADEAVVGQDAAQVGMTVEQDAEEVEGLTLEPVGARPDTDHRVDFRELVVREPGPYPQPPVVLDRQQVHHHCETGALAIVLIRRLVKGETPGGRVRDIRG
jgi:hypothetical protein